MKYRTDWKRIVDNRTSSLGYIDYARGIIAVNKKRSKAYGKGEVLNSIAHEELHRRRPDLGERLTEKFAVEGNDFLDIEQKRKLLSRYKGRGKTKKKKK